MCLVEEEGFRLFEAMVRCGRCALAALGRNFGYGGERVD